LLVCFCLVLYCLFVESWCLSPCHLVGAPVHVVMGMAGRNYQYKTTKVLAEWEVVLEEELGYTVIKADRKEFEFDFFRGLPFLFLWNLLPPHLAHLEFFDLSISHQQKKTATRSTPSRSSRSKRLVFCFFLLYLFDLCLYFHCPAKSVLWVSSANQEKRKRRKKRYKPAFLSRTHFVPSPQWEKRTSQRHPNSWFSVSPLLSLIFMFCFWQTHRV